MMHKAVNLVCTHIHLMCNLDHQSCVCYVVSVFRNLSIHIHMVQLNFSMKLMCTIPMCFPLILHISYLQVDCMSFYMWSKWHPMEKNNVSCCKCELCRKHKQETQDVAQHKSSLKVLYVAYMLNGLDDSSVDNSTNMATLSMEPRNQIITFHSNYYLPSYWVSCRHITWLQKCCNYVVANQMLHGLLPS